jgi:hypothetical protein
MRRLRMGVVVLMAAVVACSWSAGDNRADDKAPVKVRGNLPPGFKRLGLSPDQTQEVYRIRSTYRSKIDELQAKIDQLKKEERLALDKVLTPAQKERLREIRAGETPKTESAPTGKGTVTEKK